MCAQLFNFKFQKTSPTLSDKDNEELRQSKNLVLTDEMFNKLREVIYNICGIYFTDTKKYLLEGRVQNRIIAKNLSSYQDYINLLTSFSGREELNELFDAITINETYFFRAEQQFEIFEKNLIPEIIKAKKTNKVVTIWSAASSSGEEAYTLALIIKERLQPLYRDITFKIFATDISPQIIDQARAGIYREYAVRNIPQNLIQKYFKKVGTNYELSDDIKRMVQFSQLNLYDTAGMRRMMNVDIVFCCNVLIYFDMASKQKVVSQIYDCMSPGGYLFIGYSESLHGISKSFKLVHYPKVMVYQKEFNA